MSFNEEVPGANAGGFKDMTTGSLTVLFEDPFWIGLFEMTDEDGLHVCKEKSQATTS